jgi:hypothetical protein
MAWPLGVLVKVSSFVHPCPFTPLLYQYANLADLFLSKQVRSSSRYGDGSMHYRVSSLLSMLSLSIVYSLFSNYNFRGPRFALHAYVQVCVCPIPHKNPWLSIVSSTLNQGVSSHKKIPKEQSWILRQYYGNNIVLFLFCACNELFFVSIYLLSFPPPPNSPPRLGKSIKKETLA